MPKQIVFLADGLTRDFDSVSCWPKQWFPDGAYAVRAEPSAGDSARYRIVVTPNEPLPVPGPDVYSEVEVGVDFFSGDDLVASLRDTVRPPGRPSDDQEACDPVCVE